MPDPEEEITEEETEALTTEEQEEVAEKEVYVLSLEDLKKQANIILGSPNNAYQKEPRRLGEGTYKIKPEAFETAGMMARVFYNSTIVSEDPDVPSHLSLFKFVENLSTELGLNEAQANNVYDRIKLADNTTLDENEETVTLETMKKFCSEVSKAFAANGIDFPPHLVKAGFFLTAHQYKDFQEAPRTAFYGFSSGYFGSLFSSRSVKEDGDSTRLAVILSAAVRNKLGEDFTVENSAKLPRGSDTEELESANDPSLEGNPSLTDGGDPSAQPVGGKTLTEEKIAQAAEEALNQVDEWCRGIVQKMSDGTMTADDVTAFMDAEILSGSHSFDDLAVALAPISQMQLEMFHAQLLASYGITENSPDDALTPEQLQEIQAAMAAQQQSIMYGPLVAMYGTITTQAAQDGVEAFVPYIDELDNHLKPLVQPYYEQQGAVVAEFFAEKDALSSHIAKIGDLSSPETQSTIQAIGGQLLKNLGVVGNITFVSSDDPNINMGIAPDEAGNLGIVINVNSTRLKEHGAPVILRSLVEESVHLADQQFANMARTGNTTGDPNMDMAATLLAASQDAYIRPEMCVDGNTDAYRNQISEYGASNLGNKIEPDLNFKYSAELAAAKQVATDQAQAKGNGQKADDSFNMMTALWHVLMMGSKDEAMTALEMGIPLIAGQNEMAGTLINMIGPETFISIVQSFMGVVYDLIPEGWRQSAEKRQEAADNAPDITGQDGQFTPDSGYSPEVRVVP